MRNALHSLLLAVGILCGGTLAGAQTFTVVAAADAGTALTTEQFGSTSIPVILDHALAGLSKQPGLSVKVNRAFALANRPDLGGMTFTGALKGKPIVGLALCKACEWPGYECIVIYSHTDATRADWDKLSTAATRTSDGVDVALRIEDAVQLIATLPDVSMMFVTGMSGPADTFEKDKPILLAMLRTFQPNRALIRNYEAQQRMIRDTEEVVRDRQSEHERFMKYIRGEDAPATQHTGGDLAGLLTDLLSKFDAQGADYPQRMIKAVDAAAADATRFTTVQLSPHEPAAGD
jgi:hypothetical protein